MGGWLTCQLKVLFIYLLWSENRRYSLFIQSPPVIFSLVKETLPLVYPDFDLMSSERTSGFFFDDFEYVFYSFSKNYKEASELAYRDILNHRG